MIPFNTDTSHIKLHVTSQKARKAPVTKSYLIYYYDHQTRRTIWAVRWEIVSFLLQKPKEETTWKAKAWLQNDITMYFEKAEGVIRGLDD